jgi:hypothetical protein
VAVQFVHVRVAALVSDLAHERVFSGTLLFSAAFGQMIDKFLLVANEKSLAVHATVKNPVVVHVVSSMIASKLT